MDYQLDNFASWGGGGAEYHNEDLNSLIKAVDYVSMHTYPFHDTHYNPMFWSGESLGGEEMGKGNNGAVENAMARAVAYSQNQYAQVVAYVQSIDEDKPVHIGETGWASISDGFYGPEGQGQQTNTSKPCFTKGCAIGPKVRASVASTSRRLTSLGKALPIPPILKTILACSQSTVRRNTPFGRWSSTVCSMG